MNLEDNTPRDWIQKTYEDAEAKYEAAKLDRDTCRAQGNARGERAAERRMDRYEEASTRAFQALYGKPYIGSIHEPMAEPTNGTCSYCDLPLAEDEWVSQICPVCDPDRRLDSRDPRWTPYQAERERKLNEERGY